MDIIREMEAELTRQENISKFELYNKWCTEIGVIAPKLKYPAFFYGDSGVCGVEVVEEIKHNEAMFSVPFKAIITVEKAKAEP